MTGASDSGPPGDTERAGAPPAAPAAATSSPVVPAAPRPEPNRPRRRSWRRRIAGFLVAFAISLLVGKTFEAAASKSALDAALRAQDGWIAALETFSPWSVASSFTDHMNASLGAGQRRAEFDENGQLVFRDPQRSSPMEGLTAPTKAFFATVIGLAGAGGVVGLMQLAMGALAVGAGLVMLKRAEKRDMPAPLLIAGWPLAVIFAASLIAVAIKALMLVALAALSWVTELAATAAGAGGVLGFCWYCAQKLGEKGAETALTPKI